MNDRTKKITAIGMISALAFLMVLTFRIPVVLFLKYEPKDVIITLGGFIWGPAAAFISSVIASMIEMVTISETGIWGLVMNILSTCSFACTSSLIYKKKRTLRGAVIGLTVGLITMVCAMMLWNYLITPLYMGYPREAVAALLIPAFLPFNLIKGGLNASITFLLYKPVVTALRKAGYIKVTSETQTEQKKPVVLWAFMGAVIVICVLLILHMNGTI